MKQKEVKIIGLSVNQQLGILQAVQMQFDPKKKLIVVKGGVGEGKTTFQKSLQAGTLGSKTFTDKRLYGDIDTEVQLLDGDLNVWIGCKSDDKGNLNYVLYTKDENGKKVKNPVIDGVSATPSKYLQALQTELTWKLNELMSENPTVQRNLLLKLYQHEFIRLGVIFDKKSPQYEGSILHRIEKAEEERTYADMKRKQIGGIKEDLIAQGFDPERPATCPDEVNIAEIDRKIEELKKLRTIEETKANSGKENELQKILTEVEKLTREAVEYNQALDKEYQTKLTKYEQEKSEQDEIKEILQEIENQMQKLKDKGIKYSFQCDFEEKQLQEPKAEPHINFDNDGKIITTDKFDDSRAQQIIDGIIKLREKYLAVSNEEIEVDLSHFDEQIKELEQQKAAGIETNKIVEAIDAWHSWKEKDDLVQSLKKEYYSLLKEVNTGVEGLHIIAEEDHIFLAYDGSYDPEYFKNPNKELRKITSYSGTQQPMIALLIQNYLLNLKDKAMRYMFIDNIPIDTPTQKLLEDMAKKLNLTIFLNITGDFDQNSIKDGEILVQGGEIFFK